MKGWLSSTDLRREFGGIQNRPICSRRALLLASFGPSLPPEAVTGSKVHGLCFPVPPFSICRPLKKITAQELTIITCPPSQLAIRKKPSDAHQAETKCDSFNSVVGLIFTSIRKNTKTQSIQLGFFFINIYLKIEFFQKKKTRTDDNLLPYNRYLHIYLLSGLILARRKFFLKVITPRHLNFFQISFTKIFTNLD